MKTAYFNHSQNKNYKGYPKSWISYEYDPDLNIGIQERRTIKKIVYREFYVSDSDNSGENTVEFFFEDTGNCYRVVIEWYYDANYDFICDFEIETMNPDTCSVDKIRRDWLL